MAVVAAVAAVASGEGQLAAGTQSDGEDGMERRGSRDG